MKQDDFVIRSNFTKIPNSILRDTRLSAGAKGVYAVMVQFFVIAGFVLYKSMLMTQFSDGSASFNRCWNELKKYGYLKIKKKHVNGRYTYEYELFDCPCEPEGDVQRSETGENAAVTENKVNASGKEGEKNIGSNDKKQSKRIDYQRFAKIGGGGIRHSPKSEIQASSSSAHGSCPSGTGFSQKTVERSSLNPIANAEPENPSGDVFTSSQTQNLSHKSSQTPIQKINDWLSSRKIYEQIDYAALASGEGEDYAKEIVFLMQDVYSTPDEKLLRIGGRMLPGAMAKDRFRKLNYDMVQRVLFYFKNFAGQVQNIRAYMLTALYNEPATHHLGIHNETTFLEMEMSS